MCREAQNAICAEIEALDGGGKFQEDVWERPNGGGGISRVMAGGDVFEKAGCSLSVVYGAMPPEAVASATERGADRAKGMKPGEKVPFFACGTFHTRVGGGGVGDGGDRNGFATHAKAAAVAELPSRCRGR